MPYTTNQLITGAYYAAGVVSREFETISGPQQSDGLGWLNDILAEKRVDDGMIPYETVYSFNAQIGVEKYFIPNLIEIDTIVFFLENVRYSLVYTKRNQYFGSPRVENVETLPYQWYWEREVGGGNLYIFFKPDKNYPIELRGTFDIPLVSLNQDLLANVTTADLGIPALYGSGLATLTPLPNLAPGVLVVNNFDLMGTYSNIGALVNYINTRIIPGVKASIVVNDFVLSSTTEPPIPIYVSTNGYPPNGTRSKGSVSAATDSLLSANYFNGTNGILGELAAVSNGFLQIGSYSPIVGDIILVKNQTSALENGAYKVTDIGSASTKWNMFRTSGYDQPIKIGIGDLFLVTNGNYDGSTFVQTEDVSDVGVSSIKFSEFTAISFSNFSTIETSNYEVFNSVGFDQFYITYLRYALADRICSEYNYDTPVNVMRQLSKYESWINKKSRIIDLEMKKQSTLQAPSYFNYAFINLSKGWRPS